MSKKGVVIPLGAVGEIDSTRVYLLNCINVRGYTYHYYTGTLASSYRVCLAISKNGINFTKKGVVIPIGASGESDDAGTYLNNINYINGYFYCYYAGYDGSKYRLCLAVSKNGINFVKKGVVIQLGASGESDDNRIDISGMCIDNNYYYCHYTGQRSSLFRGLLATSKNGINFVKKGVVIPLGASGESDDNFVYIQNVFKINNRYYCSYGGQDGSNFRGCLTLSKNGINFVKKGVVIPLGTSGESDDAFIYPSKLMFMNNYFYEMYCAYDGSNYRNCLALSKNGINFV